MWLSVSICSDMSQTAVDELISNAVWRIMDHSFVCYIHAILGLFLTFLLELYGFQCLIVNLLT